MDFTHPGAQDLKAEESSSRFPGLPSFPELQRWSASRLPELPPLEIAILRNIVLDPIVPYLRYLAFSEGFDATCRFGGYDNIVQEAVGGAAGLLDARTDCVLVFARLEQLSPRLAYEFVGLSGDEVAAEVESVKRLLADVVAGIRRQTSALLLWHSLELPIHPALGALDGQGRGAGQTTVIRELNDFLSVALQDAGHAFAVDVNRCLARVGAQQFYSARHWHAARAPYTLQALREIALEDFKFIRASKGKARKVLVLDCDGVLWGGTIGEDGLSGIKLGTTFPGSAFRELQQEILTLYHRGVIVALCSKNNPEDVWEVFDRHPGMVLGRQHIAAVRINWADKAANLREIAQELNVGIDSMVMLDDSGFEADLIRQFAPEVDVIRLPPDRPSDYRAILASCGLFDTLMVSAEDRARGAAYQAEAQRRQSQLTTASLDDFLRSLEMTLEIRFADEFAMPRIAQLTQKTNQFNLTTRRYSEQDIRQFHDDGNSDVIYLRYRDRFGDAGIVGVCILRYVDGRAEVDSLMLSCRVLGRRVEHVFLAQSLELARQRGASRVIGEYRPTAKNAQVKEFYSASGFSLLAEDGGAWRYAVDLADRSPQVFDCFEIDSEITRIHELEIPVHEIQREATA